MSIDDLAASQVARLNLVVLRSPDLDRAETFYRSLGINFAREKHGRGPEHLAAVLGDVVFEIYPQTGEQGTLEVRLGFRVISLEAALARGIANGGTIVSPATQSPWGLRAVLADPDGHRVELLETTELA